MTSILDFEHTEDENIQPIFNDELFAEIFRQPDCQDIPFLVVSVEGAVRSGKSFLCNLMVCYLRNLAQVSW